MVKRQIGKGAKYLPDDDARQQGAYKGDNGDDVHEQGVVNVCLKYYRQHIHRYTYRRHTQ